MAGSPVRRNMRPRAKVAAGEVTSRFTSLPSSTTCNKGVLGGGIRGCNRGITAGELQQGLQQEGDSRD